MEVIEYVEPESWDDKGMDWELPDPRKADYAMAIRDAVMERCAVAHVSLPSGVAEISPWKTVTIDQMEAVVRAIESLAPYFFNAEYDDYDDDYTDFPKMWTYGDLVREEGCRLYAFAKPGDLCENGGAWLKAIKNALDRLTVVKCPGAWGSLVQRYGTRHDPAFAEALDDAFSDAFDDTKGLKTAAFKSVPSKIYAWSGNTHWKCPIPDFEGDPEDNINGYCGYAESQAIRFTKVRSWLANRELDFLAYALVTTPTGAVPYSQELATSVLDVAGSGFKSGMNTVAVHVEDPLDMDFTFGNIDAIARNEVVPTSDFDSEGVAQYRRSAKRGYEGKCWFFQDYGCENGFRFRAREENV